MANGKLLYESIMEKLTGEVASGALSVGERLPSVEALRGRFAVSHITILRVLRELSDAGVVERHGRGYRISATSLQRAETPDLPTATRPVGLFLRPVREHGYDNYFNEINLAIESELAMARKNHLRSFAANCFNHQVEFSSDDCDEMLRQLNSLSTQCCGILLDERIPDHLLQEFQMSSSIPIVLINRSTGLPISTISLSPQESAELLFEKAIQLGYTEIILCGNPHMRYPNDALRFQCCIELNQHNEKYQQLHLHIQRNDLYRENLMVTKILQMCEKIARKGKPLILSSSDGFGFSFVEALENAGWQCRRDFGVCGFYCDNRKFPDGRQLSTVRVNTDFLGRNAVRMLLLACNQPWERAVKQRICPIEFVFGETM